MREKNVVASGGAVGTGTPIVFELILNAVSEVGEGFFYSLFVKKKKKYFSVLSVLD